LLFEAAVGLTLARLVIAALPFRFVAGIASGGGPRPAPVPPSDRKALIGRVSWAVQACARRAPFRALCLEQGLTAQVILHRRGVESVLFYGVAKNSQDRLIAHVWVRCAEAPVIGCEDYTRYTELARFPPKAGVQGGYPS
jgi:hypothetical protein